MPAAANPAACVWMCWGVLAIGTEINGQGYTISNGRIRKVRALQHLRRGLSDVAVGVVEE